MRALAESTAGTDRSNRGVLDVLDRLHGRVDVLVVGGGPAGSTAAIGLARLGLRVAICEHAPPRRSKCCGQCLNPRVAGILQRFGVLEGVEAIAVGRTDRFEWRLDLPRGRSTTSPRPRDVLLDRAEPGWIVRREDLDELLWNAAVAAGAVPLRGVAARVAPSRGDRRETDRDSYREVRLDDGRDGVRSLAARLVVGADGLGSGVARAMGCAGPRRAGRKFGFSAALFESNEASPLRAIETGCIHMRSIEGGYLGLVREGDGTVHVAGLVGPRANLRRPAEFVAVALGLAETPRLDRLTACGPLPWTPRAIAGRGVVLVGDAAGYVEPFTGEGMAWAIEGAAALVDAVAEHGLGEAGRDTYVRRHRAAIARRQRTCRRLVALLDRPGVVAAAWRFADRLHVADRAVSRLGRRFAAGLVRA